MKKYVQQLWARVGLGDQAAWSELISRYAALVYSVARRMGLPAFDADDCAQHTWLALYRNRYAIKDPSGLPAWLIMTTKRQALRMLQRQQRRKDSPLDVKLPDPVIPPDDELLLMELQDALEHAIEQLDTRCQELITSLFLADENVSYHDIAKAFKVSINAVGRMRSRCLERLRKILVTMGYLEH